MILYKKDKIDVIEKYESGHCDILYVSCKIAEFHFNIIIVYLDTKEKERNEIIKGKLYSIMTKIMNSPILVLGDFNGHVGFIGKQEVNNNGNIVLDMAEKFNLVILNGDPRCEGETTWSRGELKSSIDFIMCNQEMYKKFLGMYIDEEKEVFDLSDHHLLEVFFEVNQEQRKKEGKKKITYMKINEETIQSYVENLERSLTNKGVIRLKELEGEMETISKNIMEKTFWKNLTQENELEPMWFTKEIKKEIGVRRQYNKKVGMLGVMRNRNNTLKCTKSKNKRCRQW